LVRRIDALLNAQGYTVRGVQRVLAQSAPSETGPDDGAPDIFAALRAIRDDLGHALTQDDDTA
jgi:hypothetical protein